MQYIGSGNTNIFITTFDFKSRGSKCQDGINQGMDNLLSRSSNP